jgi:hypothetical protein
MCLHLANILLLLLLISTLSVEFSLLSLFYAENTFLYVPIRNILRIIMTLCVAMALEEIPLFAIRNTNMASVLTCEIKPTLMPHNLGS